MTSSHLFIYRNVIKLTGYPQIPLSSHKALTSCTIMGDIRLLPVYLKCLLIAHLSDCFLNLQSMGTDEGIRMLVKTSFFYIAITLEAFIFCFAGEYLSNKVSIQNH